MTKLIKPEPKKDPFHYKNEKGEEVIIPLYPTRMTPDERKEYEDERTEYWRKKGVKI